MTLRLTKIDEHSLSNHYYLTPEDECWYFGEYTAYRGWSFSETNQLIKNFKKSMALKNTAQWPHKLRAIDKVGRLIASTLNPNSTDGVILIPVPPSKIHSDPEYDPRVLQALKKAEQVSNLPIQVCDCISQTVNREADHISDAPRLRPEERANTYRVNQSIIPHTTSRAIIVDDVLTTGSHYKGIELVLKRQMPNLKTYGLFVARTVHSNPFREVNFNEFSEED